jgi:hypothetical protein
MHAYQDLREFLTVLEQQKQLLCYSEPVALEPDLAAAACALNRIGASSPAILFDRIDGYADAQLAMNVHGRLAGEAEHADQRARPMSAGSADGTPSVCSRCRSATVVVRSTSPVAGVWSVFGCTTCLYVWRSTEPDANRDPDHYPDVFRLDPAKLASLPVAPTVPPLRRVQSKG